jgi:cytochrome b561
MRMHTWIGVAAAAVALLFMAWMYLTLEVHTPPPVKQNATTSQASQSPPAATAVKPPFDASAYEVNYTLVFAVSFSGITMTVEGWMVIGTGPAGNYSFGMFTVPLQGTATFKSATEDNTTYTMTCLHGYCTVDEEEWPFTSLIEGVNVTRTAKGQCRQLNHTGTLYEERGMLDPKAFSRFVEGLSGNYTAYVCEANGVMLSADLTATASAHGEPTRITLKMEAVKAGPYSSETYRLILKEVKATKQ